MTALVVVAVLWVVANGVCLLCLYRTHALAERMNESWEQSDVECEA